MPLFSSKKARADPKAKTRKQKVLTCPQCGGHDLYYENALITGFKYHCKDCDYIGAFIIEQEVELDSEGKVVGGQGAPDSPEEAKSKNFDHRDTQTQSP